MEVELAVLVDALDHGVVATNGNDVILYANAAAVRHAGRDLVGRKLEDALGGAERPQPQRARGSAGEELLFYSLASDRIATLTRYLHAAAAATAGLTSVLDVEQVLSTVVGTLVAGFDAALARVWLFDPATRSFALRASAGPSRESANGTREHVERVARERRPFVRNGLAGDSQFDQDWIERERIVSAAIYPIFAASELRGVLAYFSRRALADGATEVLAAYAALLSISLGDAQLLTRAEVARERAEAAQRRAAFLAEATAALASASDADSAMQKVVRAAVPQLGDWCAIDLAIGSTGRGRRVAAAHVDPTLEDLPLELQRRYPADPTLSHGFPHVLRTGQVEYWPEVPESMLRGAARDEDHLKILRQLGFVSYMCVPLMLAGRVLGAMTFVSANPERRFAPADLVTAEDLARRTAVTVEGLEGSSSGRDNAKDPTRASQTTR